MEDINRIKVVLCEKKMTSKELAALLGKSQCTVSRWMTNTCQPDLQTLRQIAKILKVDVTTLLNSPKNSIK